MKPHAALPLCIAFAGVGVFACSASILGAGGEASIVGIDHVSVAVRGLERGSEAYRALGFSLKAGRLHADGIRNSHVKFKDGSGIELITASEPKDSLAARYVDLLADGEGPVFMSIHARDTGRLLRALQMGGR